MISRRAIKRFSDEIARRFRPEKIFLFGSYACGEPTPDSDVDLLVVMSYDRRRGRMALRILEALDYHFPLDLLVRTPPLKCGSDSAGGIASSRKCWPRERCSMKPRAREWVKKAENDFKVAAQILRRRKGPVPDAVCFHRQQCVEKYLKPRLVEASRPFPKTHDLFLLVNLTSSVEPHWLAFSSAAKAITKYAVDSRYPCHSAILREARTAMKHCRLIRAAACRRLGLKA